MEKTVSTLVMFVAMVALFSSAAVTFMPTPDAFAAKGDKDKLESLTVEYSFSTTPPETVMVTDKKNILILSGELTLSSNTLIVEKSDFNKNKFDSKIFFSDANGPNTEIHTSCSKPLSIGLVFGEYTIVNIVTENGNDSCGGASTPGTPGPPGPPGMKGMTGATGPAGADGSDGAIGMKGMTGTTGPAGADGQDGAGVLPTYVRTTFIDPSAGSTELSGSLQCDAGDTATGGGAHTITTIFTSAPLRSSGHLITDDSEIPTGWFVRTDGPSGFDMYVICMNLP